MNYTDIAATTNSSDIGEPSPTVVLGVLYCIVIFCAGCGNSLLVISIGTQPKLRRPCNVYIAGMGVTDLAFLLSHLTTIDACFRGYWLFGEVLCTVISMVTLATAIISLAHLVTIALHRYLYVCKHNKAMMLFTWKATWIIEALTWIVGLIFLLPSFFITKPKYDPRINMCIFESQRPGQWVYPLYLFAGLILLPCSASIWSYYKIYNHVKKIKLRLMKNQSLSTERKAQMVTHQLQQLFSRVFVFMLFLLTFLPFLVVKTLDSLVYIPVSLHKVSTVLLSVNTMINPIIYGALNKTFRTAYTRTISPGCCHGNKVHVEHRQSGNPRGTVTGNNRDDDLDSIVNCGTVEGTNN